MTSHAQPISTSLRLPSQQLVKVVFKPCREQLSPELAKLLNQEVVESFGRWSYVPPASHPQPSPQPLAVVHALAGAEGPDVRLCPDGTDPSSLAVFEAEHSTLLESQATIVVRFDDSDLELVFVPVKVKTGSTSTGAAYWGYTVPAHLLNLASTALHCGRLLVVFDLDETLVMAHTVDSLSQRIRRVNAAKEAKAAELRSLNSSNSPDEQSLLQKQQLLQAELALLDAEVQLLQADFEMLDYYRRDMSCRVLVKGPGAHSRLAEPSWEKVYNSQGVELTRPVVRVEVGGRPLIFTRIDPANRKTSVLLRLRPNWWQLKDYLSGMDDVRAGMQRRQRWEVFICTTAEKEYAMEAWRLLDPDFSIFGREELLLKRMLCVPHPQKKDLLNVLRQELINLERVSNPFGPATVKLLTDEARGLKAAISTAQLTVVVDDRADVWDQASRKALLQVMPFHPHKEAAALDMGPAAAPPDDYEAAKDSEAELLRVMQTLKELRSKFYSQLDMEIKPEAQRLVSVGLTELLQALPLEILPPIRPVSELLAESSCKPPAALGLTEREDRASDLRLLANDSTMMTLPAAPADAGTAGAAPGGTGAAAGAAGTASAPVTDPRKRRAAAAAAAGPAATTKELAAGQPATASAADARQQEDQQEQRQDGVEAAAQVAPPHPYAHIAGILETLTGAAHKQQQQQQQQDSPAHRQPAVEPGVAVPAVAIAAGGSSGRLVRSRPSGSDSEEDQLQQQASKKRRQERDEHLAGVGVSRAATPGLNNSIGTAGTAAAPGAGGGVLQQLPPHPLAACNNPTMLHMPPADVVSVLRGAAAACASPDDLAAYQALFPLALRGLASPGQLLEVLGIFSCRLSTSHESALQQIITDSSFRLLKQLQQLIKVDKEVSNFLLPVVQQPQLLPGLGVTAGAGGAASAADLEQLQAGTGAGSAAGGTMTLHTQQQPQQQQSWQQPALQTETVDFRNLGKAAEAPSGAVFPAAAASGSLNVSGPPSASSGGFPVCPPKAPDGPGSTGRDTQCNPQQADPMQSDADWNQQHQKQQALDLTMGHTADQPNQQQGYPPFPTPELLERLGHAPDSFSYAYEAMQAAAAHIDVQSLLQSNANKSAADVLWQLTYRGPRIEYLTLQGDRRPGKVQRSPDPCFTCVLHYWGKNWGYGYASKKKAAKRQAAEDALGNMWVSGLLFDRLPKYDGARPAGLDSTTAGGVGTAAAESQQQKQQQQQQQQQMPSHVQLPQDNTEGCAAQDELRRRYGPDAVKYTLTSTMPNGIEMKATLYQGGQKNRVVAQAVGSGWRPDLAIESAAQALLNVLHRSGGQAAAAGLLAAMGSRLQPPLSAAQPSSDKQQQQQPQQLQHKSGQWDMHGVAAGAGASQMQQRQPGPGQEQQPQQQMRWLQTQPIQPATHAQQQEQQQQREKLQVQAMNLGNPQQQQLGVLHLQPGAVQQQQQPGLPSGPPPPSGPPSGVQQLLLQHQAPSAGPSSNNSRLQVMLAAAEQSGAQVQGAGGPVNGGPAMTSALAGPPPPQVRPPGPGPGSSGFIVPHSSSSSQMPASHGGQMNVQGLMALGTLGAHLGLHEQLQHHAYPSPAQPLQQAVPTLQAGVQGMMLPPQFAQHQQQQQHTGVSMGVPAVQQFAQGAHSSQPPWRVHAQGQQPGGDHYKQQNMGGMHGRMQGR